MAALMLAQARLAIIEHMLATLPLDPALERAAIAASLAKATDNCSRAHVPRPHACSTLHRAESLGGTTRARTGA